MDTHRLIIAIKRRNLEGINSFLQEGGDVNGFLHDNMTPLIYALDHCQRKPLHRSYDNVILRLINAGANVNVRHPRDHLTALMLALEHRRSEEVVRHLINAGSDVRAQCALGLTALIYAIQNRYSKDIIAELLNRGAEVNRPALDFTPLFCALRYYRKVEIVELLLNAGANVNIRDWFGRSLFILYCKKKCDIDGVCKYKKITDLLFKNGIDIKTRDTDGNTIIHNVTCNYMIHLARKNGVSIETKNQENKTPLLLALLQFQVKKVKDLLLLNANPNCVDSRHFTPLHYKEIMSSAYFDSLLLYHGADLLIKNTDWHTPLSMILPDFNNYNITECEDGIKMMIRHYLLFINENDLDDYFDKFDSNTKQLFISYISCCKDELNDMRYMCVKEELTIYNFCHLKKTYRDKHIWISVNEYQYTYEQIRDLFPIYEDLIILRLKDNGKKKFRDDLIKYLDRITVQPLAGPGINSDVKLYYDCWYMIGQYLNYKQLYNLFLASLEN